MKHKSMSVHGLLQALTSAALIAMAGFATQAQSAEAVFNEAQPVTLVNSVYYDLKSTITGREYRIFISAPADAGPDKAYPVLYMFDGNRTFPRAAGYANGIVVGIGYQLQDAGQLGERR